MTFSELIEQNPSFAVIIPMIIGALIAGIITVINKKTFGKLICAIIDAGAESEETAVKREDLNLKIGAVAGRSLKNENSGLRKIISVTEDCRLFIDPKMQSRADVVYNPKDASIAGIILLFIGIAVVGIILLKLVPWLLEKITSVFGTAE